MAFDKKQLYSNVKLTWPNAEERDYLLGLLAKDGITCGYADNTPVNADPTEHKKKLVKKEEKKPEAPKAAEAAPAPTVGEAKANIDAAPAAGSPGVITDEEAKKALEE